VSKSIYIALALTALVLGSAIPLIISTYFPQNTVSVVTYTSALPEGKVISVKETPSETSTGLAGVTTFKSYEELANFLMRNINLQQSYNTLFGKRYYFDVLLSLRAGASVPVALPAVVVTPTMTVAVASVSPKAAVTESTRASTTNVQVAGVDELDIVKTNGVLIATTSWDRVFVVSPSERKVLSVIQPSVDGVTGYSVRGIFLTSDKLVVIVENVVYIPIKIDVAVSCRCLGVSTGIPNTTVIVYDLKDPSKPKQLSTYSVTGSVLSARLVGNYVYLVARQPIVGADIPLVNGAPIPPQNIGVADPLPDTYTNIVVLDLTALKVSAYSFMTGSSSWMYMTPERLYIATGEDLSYIRPYVEVLKVLIKYMPEDLSKELNQALNEGNLTKCYEVVNKYLSALNPADLKGVKEALSKELESIKFKQSTRFHLFSVKGSEITYVGSFNVEGRLLDQFAMEEMRDYFVVATTSSNMVIKAEVVELPAVEPPRKATEAVIVECSGNTCVTRTVKVGGAEESVNVDKTLKFWINAYIVPVSETQNNVFIVSLNDLKVVGALVGLAPGERIYAARLVKNVLFLVTFRQVDPLFAIDLKNPEKPEVLGYLKIPGFSEYLHPLSEDRLLGVGVDTESHGVKISLFNVSDPTKMSVISEVKLADSYSPIFGDHHAFTLDPDYLTFYVPIQGYAYKGYLSGVLAISYASDVLKVKSFLSHDGALRTIYIGKEVFTVSDTLIKVFDAETLEELGTIKLT